MGLYWSVKDLSTNNLVGRSVHHDMKRIHGNEAAFAVSLRTHGHHTKPHIHDFEQLNYIQEGEMWFYVGDEAYHVKAGDFLRIPRNAIHWSWVKSDEPCLCFEAFSPPPPIAAGQENKSFCLMADGEAYSPRPNNGFYHVDAARHGIDIAAVEAKPPANAQG